MGWWMRFQGPTCYGGMEGHYSVADLATVATAEGQVRVCWTAVAGAKVFDEREQSVKTMRIRALP